MNENIKKFMQKVAADEELQAKMKSFTDLDSAYEFAKSVEDGFTKEEFTEIMTKLSEKMSENGELTDDDLAGVAGGDAVTAAVSVTASYASVVAAASAAAA